MAKLTDKQEQFVLGLIAGKTQRLAYKDAGYSVAGKSASYIDIRASELMKNSKVSVRYQELKGRLIKEAEDESIITAKEVLIELKKIGTAKITDYLEYRTALREVGKDDNGDPQYDWAMLVNAKDSTEVDGAPIQEVSISKDGTFKFKLYSKLDALEKIGRHLGFYNNDGSGGESDIAKNIQNLAELLMRPAPNRELPDDE